MTTQARHSAIRLGTLALGIAVFAGALYYINVRTTLETARRLGIALPLACSLSGLWHLARTWAWAECFPQPRRLGFLRLARVRMSAEAFSYLTFRGIAGEPLKVVLLSGSIDARQATAAVALERLAYLVGTTIIVGVGAACALIALPLTPLWFRVFRSLCDWFRHCHGLHDRDGARTGRILPVAPPADRPCAGNVAAVRAGSRASWRRSNGRCSISFAATRDACWCSSARLPRRTY